MEQCRLKNTTHKHKSPTTAMNSSAAQICAISYSLSHSVGYITARYATFLVYMPCAAMSNSLLLLLLWRTTTTLDCVMRRWVAQ